MKAKTLLPTIALCLTGSLASFVLADSEQLNPQSGKTMTGNQGKPWILSRVMDATVKGVEGDTLGQIKDVVLDPTTGRATFAVIQLNDTAGSHGVFTPVPWALLKPTPMTGEGETRTFTLNVDKNKFASAQKFDHWPDYNHQTWAPQVYSYYGLDSSILGFNTTTTTTTTTTSTGATGPTVDKGTGTSEGYYWYREDMSRYGPTRADGTPIDNGTAPDGKGTFYRGIRH